MTHYLMQCDAGHIWLLTAGAEGGPCMHNDRCQRKLRYIAWVEFEVKADAA